MTDTAHDGGAAEDYGEDVDKRKANTEHAFALLAQLSAEELELAGRVADAEDAVKLAKEAYRDVTERRLPEAMADLGLSEVALADGSRVSVKRAIRASVPAAKDDPTRRARALEWLVANGHGGVVKNLVEVDLPRGSETAAANLAAELLGRGLAASHERDVHAGTLSKLVRELLEEGRSVDTTLINVFDQRVASIKRPK